MNKIQIKKNGIKWKKWIYARKGDWKKNRSLTRTEFFNGQTFYRIFCLNLNKNRPNFERIEGLMLLILKTMKSTHSFGLKAAWTIENNAIQIECLHGGFVIWALIRGMWMRLNGICWWFKPFHDFLAEIQSVCVCHFI